MPYVQDDTQREADHNLKLRIYEHLHTRHRLPWNGISAWASLAGIQRVHNTEHLDHPGLRHGIHDYDSKAHT